MSSRQSWTRIEGMSVSCDPFRERETEWLVLLLGSFFHTRTAINTGIPYYYEYTKIQNPRSTYFFFSSFRLVTFTPTQPPPPPFSDTQHNTAKTQPSRPCASSKSSPWQKLVPSVPSCCATAPTRKPNASCGVMSRGLRPVAIGGRRPRR